MMINPAPLKCGGSPPYVPPAPPVPLLGERPPGSLPPDERTHLRTQFQPNEPVPTPSGDPESRVCPYRTQIP
jgi:hypothetical protein